jgi:uncharacterized protein YegP (UPF0339 family)
MTVTRRKPALPRQEGLSVAYKFEVFKDSADQFRVRFKAPNGETMFSTEGYASKISAFSAIASIQSNGPTAVIDDRTKSHVPVRSK